jgi:hypothetical protein
MAGGNAANVPADKEKRTGWEGSTNEDDVATVAAGRSSFRRGVLSTAARL